jgi:PKD repeat protein
MLNTKLLFMKLSTTLRNLSLLLLFVGNANLIQAGTFIPDTSDYCTTKGTVFDKSGIDGCGFIIELDNGTVIQPVNIIPNIVLYDSMRVALNYYIDSTVATTCQYGLPVTIDCIRDLKPGQGCSVSFTYYPIYYVVNTIDSMYYPNDNMTYVFNGSVEGEGEGVEWFWSVNDSIFSQDQYTTYTFPHFGEYNVCLSVVTSTGCQSSVCQYILADTGISGCTAKFKAWPVNYWASKSDSIIPDTSSGSENLYWFDNQSSTYSQNVRYIWDFGDGTTSYEYSPMHSFAENGQYYVCLKMIADSGECTDSYCEIIITDTNNTCNAYFEFCKYQNITVPFDSIENDSQYYNGYLIGFKNLSTPEYAYYYWDFGDGLTSSQKNPIHKYNYSGSYYVCLSVSSWNGCWSSYCKWINVGVTNCNIDFTTEVLVPDCYGYEVAHMFTPYSDQEISYYEWSFGDGEYSYDEVAYHIYENYGSYEVCLNAYTTDGCHASVCHYVYIGQDSINYEFKSSCGTSPVHDLEMTDQLSLKQIYPMPAADNLEIKLNSDIDQSISIEIMDMLGRKQMLASDYTISTGENIISLNVGQFAPGTYQIVISANEKILRNNIIITD